MNRNPFYEKDSMSSQFDKEDQIRQQKKIDFMEQQKRDYLNYLQMKDNKNTGTPFKITEDANYQKLHKNIDSYDEKLCTNLTKDNPYSRAGYQPSQWKIPGEYERNFDDKYIRNKRRDNYNIINHQIYDNPTSNIKQKKTPSLREEYLQMQSQKQQQRNEPQYQQSLNENEINTKLPTSKYQEIPNNKNNNYINNDYYYDNKENDRNITKEVISNNYNYNNYNPEPQPQISEIDYQNYLEYLKQKEEFERQKELEEYNRRNQENLLQEQQMRDNPQNIIPNMQNIQNLPNYRSFINTAEDYRNKEKSYIDEYAENMEKKKQELAYKREQEQKILTKENYELYEKQKKFLRDNNLQNNTGSNLPFDRLQEEREEYLSNKKKNVATYSNLTSMTTTNPSLKNNPNVTPYIDPEKAYENKLKEEKMKKYRRELDEQIKNRPAGAYGKINNDRRIEVPPDPCKYFIFFNLIKYFYYFYYYYRF